MKKMIKILQQQYPVALMIVLMLACVTVQSKEASIVVDLTQKRYINSISTLDRKKFFNIHDNGALSTFSADEAKYLFNELDVGLGRNIGNLTWIINGIREDSNRPGYLDPDAMKAKFSSDRDSEVNDWAFVLFDQNPGIIYGGHAPQMIPHKKSADETYFVPGTIEALAEIWANVMQYKWSDYFRPTLCEVYNEPLVKAWQIGVTKEFINQSMRAVIDTVHAVTPDVKIGGPASAWPVFQMDNFGYWEGGMKNFIDVAGPTADFISFHIYSGYTQVRYGVNTEAIFDLIENYSYLKFGQPKPMIVSEYGRYEDDINFPVPYDRWLNLNGYLSQVMQFFDRTDRLIKTIPFIVSKATWYPGPGVYGAAAYQMEDGQWVTNELMYFFEYWKNMKGDRFVATSSDPDVQVQVFVDDDNVNICLNVLETSEYTVTLQTLPGNLNVESASRSRLYLDGGKPVLDLNTPISDWSTVQLEGEEATTIHLRLNKKPSGYTHINENTFYGDQTVQKYQGTPLVYNVSMDTTLGAIAYANLRVGVSREPDVDVIPRVQLNGNLLDVPSDWAGPDIDRYPGYFFGAITIPVPVEWISENNEVKISYASSGGHVSSVVLVTGNQISGISNPKGDGARFKIFAGSPNPFKSETTIWFQVPDESDGVDAQVTIYNILGQRIKVLQSGEMNAGIQTVKWDGRDKSGNQVPTGIYLVNVQSGGSSVSKRLVRIQ